VYEVPRKEIANRLMKSRGIMSPTYICITDYCLPLYRFK